MRSFKTKSEIMQAAHQYTHKYLEFGYSYPEGFKRALADAYKAARAYKITGVGIKGSLLYRAFYGEP